MQVARTVGLGCSGLPRLFHIFFIQPAAEGHSGYFHVLATVNDAGGSGLRTLPPSSMAPLAPTGRHIWFGRDPHGDEAAVVRQHHVPTEALLSRVQLLTPTWVKLTDTLE